MTDRIERDPVASRGRANLLAVVPGYDRVDAIILALAEDATVSPQVFEQVCEAIFALVDVIVTMRVERGP